MNPIIEVDLHGMNVEEAYNKIDSVIRAADKSVYTIRIIHGYNRGDAIARMIRSDFTPALEPKVLRIKGGWNEGITELVLKELY